MQPGSLRLYELPCVLWGTTEVDRIEEPCGDHPYIDWVTQKEHYERQQQKQRELEADQQRE